MVGRTGGLSQAERQPEMENKQSPEGRGEPLISLRLTHTCPCRRSVPSPFGQGTFTGIYTRACVPGKPFPRVSGHQCNVLPQPSTHTGLSAWNVLS